ncbi:MAG TPA: metallophosphoesterase [Spirochaetota bacterium]|nr:metallophosphoesterase [Spirochaetota bacterium]
MKKYAVIGDVHGCFNTFQKLLQKLPPCDEIYAVGDLIDRGPASVACVHLAREYNIKTCLGNHEWLMLTGYNAQMENYQSWLENGGEKTLAEFKNEKELEEFLNYIKTFPPYFITGNTIICHSAVQKGLTLENAAEFIWSADDEKLLSSLIWNRSPASYMDYFVIYGHTPVKDVLLTEKYANIDTGCVYKNKLSAIIMPEKKIIQVNYCG